MVDANKTWSKYLGCLYGGAVGDALGYPVEFRTAKEIANIYGKDGIQDYERIHDKALLSDDTQMTLFTANGLLVGYTHGCLRGTVASLESYVENAYEDWLITQIRSYAADRGDDSSIKKRCSWLLNVPELYSLRAPGNTCLRALQQKVRGTVDKPINSSKGCGGVMRVAPVGLYLPKHFNDIEQIDRIGAEVAAITHGHPLGYLPAAALVHMIARIVTLEAYEVPLESIIIEAVETICRLYQDKEYVNDFETIMKKAVELAHTDRDALSAISCIGEGWVAEETLAIAVYCSLKYPQNFEKAIQASVNHDGDSDSIGAVTGNLMGTWLGAEKIPEKYIKPLELRDIIEEIAKDLYEDCPMSEDGRLTDEIWMEKYVYGTYSSVK